MINLLNQISLVNLGFFFYNLSPSSFILPFLHVSPSLNTTHWHFWLLGKYSNCDKLQRNSLFVRSYLLKSLKICIWNYMTKCDSIYADIPMQLYIKIARQKGGDSYYINVARKQRQLVSQENSYIYPLFNFLILDFLYYTKISKNYFRFRLVQLLYLSELPRVCLSGVCCDLGNWSNQVSQPFLHIWSLLFVSYSLSCQVSAE